MHKGKQRAAPCRLRSAAGRLPSNNRPPRSQPAPQPRNQPALKIGGENVLTLARKATNNGSKPEFLSVTLLPGRGMNMFQVTAAIPGKGEIPLLHSPSIAGCGEAN